MTSLYCNITTWDRVVWGPFGNINSDFGKMSETPRGICKPSKLSTIEVKRKRKVEFSNWASLNVSLNIGR